VKSGKKGKKLSAHRIMEPTANSPSGLKYGLVAGGVGSILIAAVAGVVYKMRPQNGYQTIA